MFNMVDTTDATLRSIRGVSFDATCGYVGGAYRTSAPMLAAFPTLPHLSLSVAGEAADGLDYEPGNVHSIAGAGQWLDRATVPRPCLYADLSDMVDLRNAFGSRKNLRWFLSHPQPRSLPGGYDALQWFFGSVYDLSLCADDFFGPSGPPPVAILPTTDLSEDPMQLPSNADGECLINFLPVTSQSPRTLLLASTRYFDAAGNVNDSLPVRVRVYGFIWGGGWFPVTSHPWLDVAGQPPGVGLLDPRYPDAIPLPVGCSCISVKRWDPSTPGEAGVAVSVV